jgi:restriction endonuclease S subunit
MTRSRDGWTRVRFGDIAEQINDRVDDPNTAGVDRYVGLEHLDPESLRVTRWGSPDEVSAQKLRFRPGDIIFGKRRAYQRKVALADFEGICSAHAMVLRERDGAIAPGFLVHFMASDVFMERAVQISVGSLSPTINWTTLCDVEFDLPPIEQQQRVVAVLTHARRLREALTQAKAQARLAVAAFTADVFDRTSDPIPFSDLATVQVGYPFSSDDYAEGGVRLLRCSNVGVNAVDWTPAITRTWPPDRVCEVADYCLREGDIVIAMDRPFISEGFKIARLAEKDVPSLLLQRVGRVRVTEGVNPGFVWAFLHSRRFQRELHRLQKGTDLPHISRFDIESTTLPRGAADRQASIAEQFDELHRTNELLIQRLKASNAVASGLNAYLSSGQGT